MDYFLIFLCFIIPSIHGYSLKINPHIQTAVNTLQARGSNNTLSFSQISNATILNAIPSQIQQSHQNELISFSITLVIFTIVFLVLAKIINQQVLTTYKLHLRIANLEAVCLENLQWTLSLSNILKCDKWFFEQRYFWPKLGWSGNCSEKLPNSKKW